MGAPIKINKDLLVITPNYTKKWLSEGQPKVSGLTFSSCTPFCSLRPPSVTKLKTHISEREIKHKVCLSAP